MLSESSATVFALVADAHLWQGTITAEDCTQPMADGRPATREAAGDRLARLVCADRTMATEEDIGLIADAIVEAQLGCIVQGVEQVRARSPQLTKAIVLGQGERVASVAARRGSSRVSTSAPKSDPAG